LYRAIGFGRKVDCLRHGCCRLCDGTGFGGWSSLATA
jgi:hypothetical protein